MESTSRQPPCQNYAGCQFKATFRVLRQFSRSSPEFTKDYCDYHVVKNRPGAEELRYELFACLLPDNYYRKNAPVVTNDDKLLSAYTAN